MKTRLALAATLSVAALALSATAQAAPASYDPVDGTYPAGDATGDTDPPVNNPAIDAIGLHATRTTSQLRITVKYTDLTKTSYTRYWFIVLDPATHKGRLLELRNGATRGASASTVYAYSENGQITVRATSCSGFSATPDYTKDKITFVLPAACYPGAGKDGADVRGLFAAWKASTWVGGKLSSNTALKPPEKTDTFGGTWPWTPAPSTP